MKLFKNILPILALFAIGSISAKSISGKSVAKPAGAPTKTATPPALPPRPTAPALPPRTTAPALPPRTTAPALPPRTTAPALPPRPTAPALPRKSFNHLMQTVKLMKQKDVINEDGEFTETFQNLVRSSGLYPELMEELLQAGRNLYLPLSGNDEVDMALIKYNDEIIKEFIANLGILVVVPSQVSRKETKERVITFADPAQQKALGMLQSMIRNNIEQYKNAVLDPRGNRITFESLIQALKQEYPGLQKDQISSVIKNSIETFPDLNKLAQNTFDDQISHIVETYTKEQEQLEKKQPQPKTTNQPRSQMSSNKDDLQEKAKKLIEEKKNELLNNLFEVSKDKDIERASIYKLKDETTQTIQARKLVKNLATEFRNDEQNISDDDCAEYINKAMEKILWKHVKNLFPFNSIIFDKLDSFIKNTIKNKE